MTAHALRTLRGEFDRLARVRLVAAGKAAGGMARAVEAALGERLVEGVVTDVGAGFSPPYVERWTRFPSSHPLPNDASEAAGRAALALATRVRGPNELLLVCLSGGASAMLAVPADGLTLEDKRAVNAALLKAGLDIGEMNTVRRHLSAIKGGQLAAAARQTITLAVSDVTRPADDDPLTIGSGPTVGDTTTFADAIGIVESAGIAASLPASVMVRLRTAVEGPVPPDDPRLQRTSYWVVASRYEAMRAAADTARQIGYHVRVHDAALGGEARFAAQVILDAARGTSRPACLVFSGETTVRVKGSGRGGRNQELVLAALEPLSGLGTAALASVGTDGIDGPTDAAGAIGHSEMWAALGPDARTTCADALDRNDAYPLLDELGALVKTGPTGTNVGDLQVLLLE